MAVCFVHGHRELAHAQSGKVTRTAAAQATLLRDAPSPGNRRGPAVLFRLSDFNVHIEFQALLGGLCLRSGHDANALGDRPRG